MKKFFLLTLLSATTLFGQARIARFYFNKAYLCTARTDRYDNPIKGTFIITFDTDKKTVSVYYDVEGYKPYQFSTTYSSVKETHSPGYNADYYTLAGIGYDKDCYTLVNTYDKRTKTYGVSFSTANYLTQDLFARDFISTFFGAPSDWYSWPELFFEKPYKMDSTPTPNLSSQSSRASNTLVNHIYSGVINSHVDDYLENRMTVHFLSNTKCRMKLDTKIKGSDDITVLGIIQLMMEAEGEDSQEGVFEYTYRNGVVFIKGSTDRLRVLNGGKQLRWYIDSNEDGAKKFNGILTKIR